MVGCLVEKQLTTPQQYPLTLNGLSSACNQTTNRHPVMVLDDRSIERALDELKALGLVRFVLPSHGKSVTRYRQVLDEAYGLDTQRVALLALLLLRGPQTGGELRARAERMTEFDSVGTVLHELEALAEQPGALVQLLPRRPGQKEDRWQQLLATESGTPVLERNRDGDGRGRSRGGSHLLGRTRAERFVRWRIGPRRESDRPRSQAGHARGTVCTTAEPGCDVERLTHPASPEPRR